MCNTTVDNPSNNVPIHHNCNIAPVCNLILLLNQILHLILLEILCTIFLATDILVDLLASDTGIGPFTASRDLTTVEHNALLGHTAAVAEPSGSGCTVVTAEAADVVQTTSMVVTE